MIENLPKIISFCAVFLILSSLGCDETEKKTTDSESATKSTIGSEAKQPLDPASDPSVAQTTDDSTVRFATYNVALNRAQKGDLLKELETGTSEQAAKIAEVIQRTRPDILLINEFDFDQIGEGINTFASMYLAKPQNGQTEIQYKYIYYGPVNTGHDSGHDLNHNGKKGEPEDAFGFGQFPGKYAMVVLSQYPIDSDNIRKFQKFLWKDMPDNLWPIDPETKQPYYNDEVKEIFRLSSKSHWDVPIKVGEKTIHLLAAHPTPPAFDGPEDRNGARNHDEIRMLTDYVRGKADYLYDDNGVKGGLEKGAHFVIMGDLNADPVDGDGNGKAGQLLMSHPDIQVEPVPASEGGPFFSEKQGQANTNQKGDPAFDTADFGDRRPGNLRVDYCLPSKTLSMKANGVYWPMPDEPGGAIVGASDHRMVWIDIEK